ncbi:MAG TPA: YfhO family protein [Vicinamibacteria bacterium]|nr:YfhO family protein [Vicinamibacteria bacterium]
MSRAGRRDAGLAALLFLAVALALFQEVVFGGRQFFYRDLTLQWHPQVEAFVRSVAAGSWPVWTPYDSFGQPLLANPNNEVLYPFTWLNLLLSAWTYYAWYAVFHVVLAGAGTSVLARHLGLSRRAAFVSGLLWILSGPFLSLVNLWAHMAGASWVPWIVWAGDRTLARPRLGTALLWGVLSAATVLCGSPETAVMAAALSGVLALRRLPRWWRQPRRATRAAGCALVALVTALALSAGQWLPSLDVARHSARASMGATGREYWSVHPLNLLQLAWPVFPDRLPLHAAWRVEWYESREPYLLSLYLGLPTAGLVLAGVRDGARRRWVWLVTALGLVAALVGLGRHFPAYETVLALFPPLRTLRFPAKAFILSSLCGALVAGQGLDAWRARRGGDILWTLVALAMALGAAVALAGGVLVSAGAEQWGSALLLRGRRSYTEVLSPVSRSLVVCGVLTMVTAAAALMTRLRARPGAASLAWVAAAAAGAELAFAQAGLNPTAPRAAFEGVPAVVAVARPAPHQRMFVFDYYAAADAARRFLHLARPFVTRVRQEDWVPWHGAVALRSYGFPSMLGLWGREGSFGTDTVKLLSGDVMTLNRLMAMYGESPAVVHRLLRVGAVDTVVAMHTQGFEELTPLATLPSDFVDPVLVFRVPDVLPRAYVVGRGRVAPVGQGWRALLAPDFDPSREVILPEGPALDSQATGAARIADFRPDRVEVDATLDAPGYLVLVDAYDPGWRVTVDGRPVPLLRGNVAFRAVQVPAGAHRIRFVYRPTSVIVGLCVSAVAAAALVVLWLAARLRRPQPKMA